MSVETDMGPEILLTVVLAGTLGTAIGTFTGLIPGIHVNTAAAVLLGSYPLLAEFFGPLCGGPSGCQLMMSCCILSAATVHSFVDFVPSVFIGVPDEDNILSVLPGHRLLLMGQGMRAVRAAAIGSMIGSVSAILMAVPVQWVMLSGGKEFIDHFTVGMILLALTIVVLTSRSPVLSLLFVGISGTMGYIIDSWEIPVYGILGGTTMLFPLLTGLFGIPPLLEDPPGHGKIKQYDDGEDPVGLWPGLKGVGAGVIAGWFPGITSTAGAAMASAFSEERDPARFISVTASIGTVTSVFSIVALSVSGSGRSGACIAVREIAGDAFSGFCSEAFLAALICMAFAAGIGYAATVGCGKIMVRVSDRVPESTLNDAVLALIIVLVLLMTGPFGLAILAVSAAVGMIPPSLGISRICLTGSLMVPVLLL